MNFARIMACLWLATGLLAAAEEDQSITVLKTSNSHLERFVLDNGMVVLLKEDHSAPTVSVQIWVGTGAIHEEENLGSGLSHAIEHMAFKGTKNRTVGDIAGQIKNAGGRINAYTSFDRTVFHSDIPSDKWTVALNVLSDAVMNSTFPAKEWKKEREVILREYAMGKDDPNRVLGKLLWRTAYRVHPYQYPVIGIENIFRTRSRDDLFAFYKKNYVPNNMLLVVVGDIEVQQAKTHIHQVLDQYPRKARAPIVLPREPQQLAPRQDRQTGNYQISRLELAYHIVPISHPDAVALDVLGYITGSGRSSRLNQKLKEEMKLVHSISAGAYTPKEPGLFIISTTFNPSNETNVISALRNEVDSWHSTTFTEAELQKARRNQLVSTLNELQTMHGQASSYASGEFYAGDPKFSENYLARLKTITSADLSRVAARYLTEDNSSIAILAPESHQPETTATVEKKPVPQTSKIILSNGTRLLVREDHRLPFVYVCAVMGGGLLSETEANNGISALTANLLTRGTKTRNTESIALETESMGARLYSFSGYNSFGLRGKCLTTDKDKLMVLFADCLMNSTFPKDELEKQRTIQLAAIKQQQERPMFLAKKELTALLFPGHPYQWNTQGTPASVSSLTSEMLQAHLKKLLVSDNTVISVFGDITPDNAKALVEKHLSTLPEGKPPIRQYQQPKPLVPHVVKQNTPHSQAIFLAGFPGVTVRDPRADALSLISEAMSGLASHLGMEVREKRGLVYYIGAYQQLGVDPGAFIIYAGTTAKALSKLEELVRMEINRIARQGLTEAELTRVKRQLIAEHDMSLQNNGSLALTCALNELYGLGHNYEFSTKDRLTAITRDDVRRTAAEILVPHSMAVSITLPESHDHN